MSTALIQLGHAAGFEVWTTSRNEEGRVLAEKLGAHRTFRSSEKLPRKVQAIIDSVGHASWAHSIASVKPNQPALGSHVANGAFMVSPSARGLGVGQPTGEFNFVVSTNEADVCILGPYGVQEVSKHVAHRRPPVLCKSLIVSRAGNRNRTGDLLITS